MQAGARATEPDRFVNQRSEWAWSMRELLETGTLDLDPSDDELAAQLGALKFRYDSKGRIAVESKDEMRKRGLPSPDRADAAILTAITPAGSELFRPINWRYWRPAATSIPAQVDCGGRISTLAEGWRYGTVHLPTGEDAATDWAVGAIWCQTIGGDLLLLDLVRRRLGDQDPAEMLGPLVRRHNADTVFVARRHLTDTLRAQASRARVGVTPIDAADADLCSRALVASSKVVAGKVWLPHGAAWLPLFTAEAMAYPHTRSQGSVAVLALAAQVETTKWQPPPRTPSARTPDRYADQGIDLLGLQFWGAGRRRVRDVTAPTTDRPPTRLLGRVSDAEYEAILEDVLADLPAELAWPTSVRTYASTQRDPTAWAALQGYVLQLLRATWQMDGRGCDPDLTAMVADDMGLPVIGQDEAGAARMRGVSWEDHLRAVLSNMLTFGHFGVELGAELVGDAARLVTLAERPPTTITQIHVDPKTGGFLGITQNAPRRNGSPQIPARQMAWYCHQRQGAAWQGVSLFRQVAQIVTLKREMMRVHATSNRRWGMGVPVMEAIPGTNPTSGQMIEAQQLASAARGGEQAGAATPPGFVLKLTGISGSLPATQDFLGWLDRQILRAVLMPHLELGQGTSGGARALGEAFIDSWTLSLEALGSLICDVATRQIAARIVEWNKGTDTPVPRVVVSGIGSRREVTAESLASLLTAGALSSDPALEAWVRREYRLPEREQQDSAIPTGRVFESDVATGVITKNERRAMFNLDPVEGGDALPDTRPQPAPTVPAQPAPKVAAKRKRQADGQLALPIAAAAEQDEAEQNQHDYEAALAALLAAWPALAAPLVADLSAQAAAAGVGGLASLAASGDTVDAITVAISDAMTRLARQAADRVAATAAANGVDVPPAEPDEDRLSEVAAVTAALIAAAYASAAVRRALHTPADSVAALVVQVLSEMSEATRGMVADNLGAALSTAQGQGRLAVLEARPPRLLRASERLDRSACDECRAVDGRTYASLAEAARDYGPGGMLRCAGRDRCRGLLLPVY